MIIREIHINGFGVFNDFSLSSLDKGINLVQGENEAGKSTLLRFIRYTLFGYPRPKDQRMKPLNGGAHGGRIKALLSSGEEAVFERDGNNNIKLLYKGEESRDNDLWRLLLGNATPQIYNNVYAFSLTELTGIKSLTESGVRDKIFSLGLGLGDISLKGIEKEIREHMETIYKKGGSKGTRRIPSVLSRIKDKSKEISKIRENLPQYKSLSRSLKLLEDEAAALDDELSGLRSEKIKLDNYLKCYDNFISLSAADEELKNLPEIKDYPENGLQELERLRERGDELRKRISEIESGGEGEKGIQELEAESGRIGYNSGLLEKRDKVEFLKANFEKYKQSLQERDEESKGISGYEVSIEQKIRSISGEWRERDVCGFTDTIPHRTETEKYKEIFERQDSKRADLESQLKGVMSRESSVNTENLAVLLSVIAIITSGAVVYHGFFVLGGALAVAAGLAFFGRRYLAKESPEDRIHRQIQGVVSEREKAEEEFKGYIRDELNLHDLLTPDSLLEIFRLIDEIKREIEQRDRLKSRLETERIPFIKRFEEEAEFLKPFLSDSGSSPEMMWVVSEIFREYDYALQKKSEAEELSYELQRRKRELASVDQRLKEVDGSVNELLRSVSAEDMDDFIRKYKENQRAAELKRQRRDDLRTIQRIVGINKSEEIIGYLASRDKEDMEAELQGLQKDIGSKEEEYRDRVNRLGETRNEIERIAGTSDLSEVLTEYETEKQRLRQAYLEWVAGNTALKVLSEVRQRYEIEKQPEVVKNTAGFFREITEGRYKKVTASLESEEVSIIDDKSISKGIEELSRGTKEQLLISLRLGFILEYERQGTSLPVIADEILVNFDERRAEVTAGILRDFAEQRQLLMFTCHTATKDFFSPEDVNLITL